MSKGLETLKNIFSHWNCCNPNSNGCYEEDFEIVGKELKALEIIVEKRVDVHYLQECENLKQYNDFVEMNWSCRKEAEYHNEILTQEEFDLLKEVLL